jgi:acyl-coenzyme A thioesterase PaaI-like protein
VTAADPGPRASTPSDHPFSGEGARTRLAEALERDGAELTERRRLLRLYAAATRRAINELVTTTAPDADIARAAALVEQAERLLAGGPHGRPYEGAAEPSVVPAIEHSRSFVDFSPVAGPANPIAPPLRLKLDGDGVVARVVFGAVYEGPPGCVHGGYIAAAFDEVLGFVQSFTGRPGMTGRLSVAYRSPTPLHEELVLRGRVERVDGRKILTRATLHHGDTLTADADALFISIDPSVFSRLMAQRRDPG